jgi:outer membrane protein OmpA-like peptidoglycan-associated protein
MVLWVVHFYGELPIIWKNLIQIKAFKRMGFLKNQINYKLPASINLLLICFLFLITLKSNSQNVNQIKKHIKVKDYTNALTLMSNNAKVEKNPDLLLLRAICYYYLDRIDSCLNDLKKQQSFNTGDIEVPKYMGLAYIKKQKYDEGAVLLKRYLSLIDYKHDDFLPLIEKVRSCGFALEILKYPQIAFVENLGSVINTSEEETKPVYSPNFQERVYFSSARPGSTGGKRNYAGLLDEKKGFYSADMYYSDFVNGNWTEPTTFLPLLNTPKTDIVLDFNNEGNVLFYGTKQQNDLFEYYTDTFTIEYDYEKHPSLINLPLDGQKEDKDLFFFNDSLIFFASNHLEGFGGYDIFYSRLKNGEWEKPVNLGPEINDAYNDESPFITKSGNTIYFSSDRLNGLGGYDIFKAVFNPSTNTWSGVINLGNPINSPWDENSFVISPDGMNAIYTSNKAGGFGKSDLYNIYFKEQELEQLLFTESPSFLNFYSDSFRESRLNQNKTIATFEILIKPLLYSSNEDVLSSANLVMMTKLAENMLIFPDVNLIIYCHSFQETSKDMDLYLSLKRVETVRDFFVQKGISPKRLTVKACGASYPVATPFINGIKSSIAEKNNKRIEFSLFKADPNFKVSYINLNIPETFLDEKYSFFKQAEDTLVFRLLIAQSSQIFRNEVINIFDDILIEKTGNSDTNNYLLGNFTTYKEALIIKNELLDKHNISAKMIPYFKGKKLEKEDFIQKINEMPELLLFVKNEEY